MESMELTWLRVALFLSRARCVAISYMLCLLLAATAVRARAALRSCRGPTELTADHSRLRPPSLTVIVPCYLPNECAIIHDTINHLLQARAPPAHPRPPRVRPPCLAHRCLAHSCSGGVRERVHAHGGLQHARAARCRDAAASARRPRVRERQHRARASGRRLHIQGVRPSQPSQPSQPQPSHPDHNRPRASKGANLNAALAHVESDLVAIFDADHRPDSDCIRLLAEHLAAHDADCVQGSYNISQRDGLLDMLVDADFFLCCARARAASDCTHQSQRGRVCARLGRQRNRVAAALRAACCCCARPSSANERATLFHRAASASLSIR
eukprot:3158822-Prymnesium_polylepis.1